MWRFPKKSTAGFGDGVTVLTEEGVVEALGGPAGGRPPWPLLPLASGVVRVVTSVMGDIGFVGTKRNPVPMAGGGWNCGGGGCCCFCCCWGMGLVGGILEGAADLVGRGLERNGCWRRRVALGRSLGTRLKQSSRKSWPSGDRCCGMGGGSLELAILKSAETWRQGGGGFSGEGSSRGVGRRGWMGGKK